MTGPEQRVISGYLALSDEKTSEPMDSEATSPILSARDKLQFDKLNFCEQEFIGHAQELITKTE